MSFNTFRECIITSQGDGAALTNTTTATSLLPTQAKFALPGSTLKVTGQEVKVTAMGRISTVVTTPGTLTLDVRFGGTVVMNGGAMALNVVAKTNVTWWLEMYGVMRVVGGSAQLLPVGKWESEAVVGSPVPGTGGSGVLLLPSSAPAVGTAFDSTVGQTVDLFGTWSVANAANSILVHKFMLEVLN